MSALEMGSTIISSALWHKFRTSIRVVDLAPALEKITSFTLDAAIAQAQNLKRSMVEAAIGLATEFDLSLGNVLVDIQEGMKDTGNTWQTVIAGMRAELEKLNNDLRDSSGAFNRAFGGTTGRGGVPVFDPFPAGFNPFTGQVTPDVFKVPAAQHGGLVKVGEKGTEIVHLPDQSRIFPNAAGLASMGGDIHLHVHMEGASFIGNLPEKVAQTIAEAVSERIGIEATLAERMPQGLSEGALFFIG